MNGDERFLAGFASDSAVLQQQHIMPGGSLPRGPLFAARRTATSQLYAHRNSLTGPVLSAADPSVMNQHFTNTDDLNHGHREWNVVRNFATHSTTEHGHHTNRDGFRLPPAASDSAAPSRQILYGGELPRTPRIGSNSSRVYPTSPYVEWERRGEAAFNASVRSTTVNTTPEMDWKSSAERTMMLPSPRHDLGEKVLDTVAGCQPRRKSERLQVRSPVHFDHEYKYADTRDCMLRVIEYINSLRPILVRELKEQDRTCAICFDDCRDRYGRVSHRPIKLACGHVFGERCIRQWLNPLHNDACITPTLRQSNNCCPLCRTRLVGGTCDFHDESLLGLYLKLRLWDRMYDRCQISKTALEVSSRESLYRYVADEVLHTEGTITATDRTWMNMMHHLEIRINNFATRVAVKPDDIQSAATRKALAHLKIVAGSSLYNVTGPLPLLWCFVIEHPGDGWSVDILSVQKENDQVVRPHHIEEAEDVYGELTWSDGDFHDLNKILGQALNLPRDLRIVPHTIKQSDGRQDRRGERHEMIIRSNGPS